MGDRTQETGDRSRETEDGRQKTARLYTGDGRWKTEGRRKETEDGRGFYDLKPKNVALIILWLNLSNF